MHKINRDTISHENFFVMSEKTEARWYFSYIPLQVRQ